MADLNFNANDVAPSSPNDPVPAGWYRAHAVESEVKRTKNGDGHQLVFAFKILDGEYTGRMFWCGLNIDNPSKAAQEIAQGQLSAFCHAAGVLKLTNSQQIHHIPVMVKVSVKQSTGYDPKNDVKGFKAVEGTGARPAAAASATTSAPKPAASAPAWATKRAS